MLALFFLFGGTMYFRKFTYKYEKSYYICDVGFTQEELLQLKGALCDQSEKIRRAADRL